MRAPRTRRGQFAKGHSGNLDGRPPKKEQHLESAETGQIDVLKIGAKLVTITEGGKRIKVSANHAIRLRLMHAAANGNLRAILKWEELMERRQTAYEKTRSELFDLFLNGKETIAKKREDVSDRYLELHQQTKHKLIQDYGMEHLKYEEDL